LVEPQVLDIRGGRADHHPPPPACAAACDCFLDERTTDAVSLPVRIDGHVLQFDLALVHHGHELEMTNERTRPCARHQHPSELDVLVELGRRVFGELEQCAQRFALAGVGLVVDVEDMILSHMARSSTRMSSVTLVDQLARDGPMRYPMR
jgi:hypothetical protein